jgi:hypothetical protein
LGEALALRYHDTERPVAFRAIDVPALGHASLQRRNFATGTATMTLARNQAAQNFRR